MSQQTGFVTLARSGSAISAITVRSVNVQKLTMHVVNIPDSLIAQLLATPENQRFAFLDRVARALRDTLNVPVEVHARFNVETNTVVPLPSRFRDLQPTALFAVRFSILARAIAPDSIKRVVEPVAAREAQVQPRDKTQPRRLPLFQVTARFEGSPDLGLVAQASALTAHTKIAGKQGAVFVTDRAGNSVSNASVTLYAGREGALAQGTTNAAGLAMLQPLANPVAPDARFIDRDPALTALRYVDVRHGNNRLIVPLTTSVATPLSLRLNASEFGAREASASTLRATITTDRDLYRPGETIFTKAFVRAGVLETAVAPVGDSIRVALVRGDFYVDNFQMKPYPGSAPDTIATRRSTLGSYGTAADSLQVPATARLGNYWLLAEARIGGVWQSAAQTTVRIEEFRAPEFLLTLAGDSATHYVGDTVAFTLNAKYLFGAPMARATVQWSASSASAYELGFAIPNTKGYTIGAESWWEDYRSPEGVQVFKSDTLSVDGQLHLRVPTSRGELTRPATLTVAASVADVNNQIVTTRASALMHAASLYIGAKHRDANWYWKPHTTQAIDVVVVRENGERVPGIPVRVTVVHRRYTNDSTAARPSRTFHWAVDTVKQFVVTSKRDSVAVHFTPTLDGAYDIRFEAVDAAGRTTSTNIGKWVYVWAATTRSTSIAMRVTTQRPPTERFCLGDTARVMFNSPYKNADAWITIEREGIIEQQRIAARPGLNTVRIPISTRFAPNVWAGITLINKPGVAINAADSLGPLLRVGYVELRVDSTAHLLHVNVQPVAPQLAPGDSVQVRVQVRDMSPSGKAAGARAEVALWAVDEGVLSMTGFRTPDVLRAIDAELGVAQNLRSSLSTLPWLKPTAAVRPGVNIRFSNESMRLGFAATSAIAVDSTDSAPATQSTLRSAFRLTAFYVSSVVTDSNGVATVHAKLPDNITTFRLMASAIGLGHRYGSGEATLLVTKPVVLRASLPRFVRAGDTLLAAAALNVRDGSSAPMQVTMNTTGALLIGDSTKRVGALQNNGKRLQFALMVPEKTMADVTRVVFTVARSVKGADTGQGAASATADSEVADAVATVLPIRPTGTPRAHTIVGVVSDTGTAMLTLPNDIDAARSTVTLELGTSPLVAMRSHLERLRAYSYYTTDGIVVTARALLTLANAERVLKEPLVTGDSVKVREDIERAVAQVVQRQDANGDFRYWPGNSLTMGPWFSSFVGEFLIDAKRTGIAVPETSIALIQRQVAMQLHEKLWLPDTVYGNPLRKRAQLQGYLGARLEMANFLRRSGRPAIDVEDALVRAASQMVWEDRVALVELMAQRSELSAGGMQMLGQLWSAVSIAGKRIDFPDSLRGNGTFPSHIRPAARLLLATMKLAPSHPQLGALRETIIQQSAAEREWAWNVHDHGAAIEALAAFASTQRGDPNARLVARAGDGQIVFSRALATAANARFGEDTAGRTLAGLLATSGNAPVQLKLSLRIENEAGRQAPQRNVTLYYAMTVHEVPRNRPVTPDIAGLVVERWYERFDTGEPILEAKEGDLVRVRLRVTASSDRQFVALEDLLPAGLEAVDLTLKTSSELGPFAGSGAQHQSQQRLGTNGPIWQSVLYGGWDNGWFSPWEYKELRDDRVMYFTRQLWAGTYNTSYVARATSAGTFVRPPAHAEEMYNAAVQGRSDGGVFVVRSVLHNH